MAGPLIDLPDHAAVSMHPGGGQLDPASTVVTARWAARKES